VRTDRRTLATHIAKHGSRLTPVAGVLVLALAFVAAAGCAPGFAGTWELSGDVDRPEYQRFQGTIRLTEQGTGEALLDLAGSRTVRMPLCALARAERTIWFTLDASGAPSPRCDALSAPLLFEATLGHNVLAGTVRDSGRNAVGMWRAFRRNDP